MPILVLPSTFCGRLSSNDCLASSESISTMSWRTRAYSLKPTIPSRDPIGRMFSMIFVAAWKEKGLRSVTNEQKFKFQKMRSQTSCVIDTIKPSCKLAVPLSRKKKSSSGDFFFSFCEIEWDVAISWQFRGLRGDLPVRVMLTQYQPRRPHNYNILNVLTKLPSG